MLKDRGDDVQSPQLYLDSQLLNLKQQEKFVLIFVLNFLIDCIVSNFKGTTLWDFTDIYPLKKFLISLMN